MAGGHSPSTFQEPMYSIAAQQPVSKPSSRRLPLPCWSDDETVALIDVYREKWYTLCRGNLRAPDWGQVAEGVAGRCPNSSKTSIQCRHKMEKLRKRYRAEIQRIGNGLKGNRYHSSWNHFKLMHSMELGFSGSDPSNLDDADADEVEEDLMLYPKAVKQAIDIPINRRDVGVIGTGVRIKIPSFVTNSMPFDDLPPPVNPRYGSVTGLRNVYMKEGIHGGGTKRKDDGNVMDEMVAAIQKLGDRFVKMERMKMDMARELESMRMKAEMKQTEMILETQQKMWELFSETVMEGKNKKVKRMSETES